VISQRMARTEQEATADFGSGVQHAADQNQDLG
jgi:uncharacterized protein with PIN domain